ncbi:MAG: DNA repair protein RecN [Desulfovibrio sp.]|jgi:DNA repair protein RecN (Recombination protein N)|nr:DNA repair protein RecN [Desulfovibrio sp.]
MLEYLRIRNLALIEDMELEFSQGMNVLTGETGAGKSFILKALGFLLGDKLSHEIVRPGADRAQVEALFFLNEDELVVRREISARTGRSRLYVNEDLKSQESLREMRERLVTHTSQHAQQLLLRPAFQAKLIEAAIAQSPILHERDILCRALAENVAKREALQKKYTELTANRDLLKMQQVEIDKVSPEDGEEERLDELRTKIRNSAQLFKNYEEALSLLHGESGVGLLDLLGKLERLLNKMCTHGSDLEKSACAVAALREQLAHFSGRLRRQSTDMEETDVNKVEERLFVLAQLKRKLHKTFPEILALRKEIDANLSFLDACSLDLARFSKEEKTLGAKLKNVVDAVIPLRRDAARKFSERLKDELRGLGFSRDVAVIPDFIPQEIRPGIHDETVRFLWAPNPGHPPQPLDRIASGGELSRFLLAIMSMRSGLDDTTYIFDEVDAGVGGLVLNNLAEKLKSLAEKHQMLLITHWPQLAAQAKKHFQINKEVRDRVTFTVCAQLDGKERLAELARMAGGGAHGEALARNLQD